MDLTPKGIRAVQFREKVRGYHPADVDAFVAAVADAVEAIERRLRESEGHRTELESRASAGSEAEDSLRRTLVLAQRTADAAMEEARQEAAKVMAESATMRAAADADLADLRRRIATEVESEGRDVRERLESQRAALLADVEALEAHLGRERERLRIYFADQLRRVEEGSPSTSARPELQAEEPPDRPPPARPPFDGGEHTDAPTPSEQADDDASGVAIESGLPEVSAGSDVGDRERAASWVGEPNEEVAASAASNTPDDDPFLAELRRAVTDSEPLGPRDDPPDHPSGEGPDDGFDLFAKGDDESGRFGSRLRRKR